MSWQLHKYNNVIICTKTQTHPLYAIYAVIYTIRKILHIFVVNAMTNYPDVRCSSLSMIEDLLPLFEFFSSTQIGATAAEKE